MCYSSGYFLYRIIDEQAQFFSDKVFFRCSATLSRLYGVQVSIMYKLMFEKLLKQKSLGISQGFFVISVPLLLSYLTRSCLNHRNSIQEKPDFDPE